jgi:transcriptional regulator with XRE-family HTH domain
MQERERRHALAAFLRQRRARLTPAEVGLPAGIRRRTPGLRREEVAQLANIGTSWYVWLEQGRDVHPSPQVLECLAQALKLTPNERRHLFLLAGQALPSLVMPTEEHVSVALQQMLDDLNPSPACVIGRRYDYLAWNQADDVLFAISPSATANDRNMVWRLFTSPTMRASMNWQQIARSTLAEFHTASVRYPDDPAFTELIDALRQMSPEFRDMWPQHEVRRVLDGHKVIVHPTFGRLEFEHMNLQVLSDPDLRIMVYSPSGETRAKMERIASLGVASDV